MIAKVISKMVLLMMTAAVGTYSAVIYQDNFSDPVASYLNWTLSMSDSADVSYSNLCIIVNKSSKFSGLLRHSLSAPKPQTFTMSFGIEYSSAMYGSAAFFCLQQNSLMGYGLHFTNDNYIYVYKYGEGQPVELLLKRSGFLKNGKNTIKISKSGSKFNLFVNGEFDGCFEDGTYSDGDVGFLASPNATVQLQSFMLTDQFEEHNLKSVFVDEFNGPAQSNSWVQIGGAQPPQCQDGFLKVSSGSAEQMYYYVNADVENFISRAVVSHRGGPTNRAYGIVLLGELQGGVLPAACFGVCGLRLFAAFLADGSSVTMQQSQKIRGAGLNIGGVMNYFTDTLEVQKPEGSDTYVFKVNGAVLQEFSGVNFKVTGVGIFTQGQMDLDFDFFGVAEGDEIPSSVSWPRRRVVANDFQTGARPATFDLRGRMMRNDFMQSKSGAAGVYLNTVDGVRMLVKKVR